MGAFNTRPPIRIENQDGWDDGESITIKGVVTAEDMQSITVQTMSADASGKVVAQNSMSMTAALECMIVDWNLFGDNKQLVPLYEGQGRSRHKRSNVIKELPMEYMTPVMAAIGELVNKAAVQQPENFQPSANGLSVAS